MYDFISMYAFLHTGTYLEAALEQIDVATSVTPKTANSKLPRSFWISSHEKLK